jgi:hypothetical protein
VAAKNRGNLRQACLGLTHRRNNAAFIHRQLRKTAGHSILLKTKRFLYVLQLKIECAHINKENMSGNESQNEPQQQNSKPDSNSDLERGLRNSQESKLELVKPKAEDATKAYPLGLVMKGPPYRVLRCSWREKSSRNTVSREGCAPAFCLTSSLAPKQPLAN